MSGGPARGGAGRGSAMPAGEFQLREDITMRALCGAIITAGAMIGLGLFSIGVGTRYGNMPHYADKEEHFVKFRELDTTLMATMVILVAVAIIGLGIAYLG